MKKQHFPTFARFMVFILLVAPIMTWGNDHDCYQAGQLFNDSLKTNDLAQQNSLLYQAVGLCPDHVQALNNLADLREKEGNLSDARWFYYRATQASPNFALPYAGLGDVLMQQKEYQEAAVAFQNFLSLLNEPGNQKFKDHTERYQARLKEAQNHISSIDKDKMVAMLTQPTRTFTPPKVDVYINFQTNSAKIDEDAWRKCQLMAEVIHEVFKQPGFQNSRIRVDGHTDSRGTASYNKWLSERRATSVKKVLVKDFGVPSNRLEIVGFGEERPLTKNRTAHERFLNRRVTLVRLDK